jgi:formate-dependent nitrite reductase cytochrome c552 subunit
MQPDPVDIDLGRHLAAMSEDESLGAWLDSQALAEEARAKAIFAQPEVWEWDTAFAPLTTTGGVPYTAEEVLIDALDSNKDAQAAYMALLSGNGSHANLHKVLAAHWANKMWETRTHGEISAAIAAEKEDF